MKKSLGIFVLGLFLASNLYFNPLMANLNNYKDKYIFQNCKGSQAPKKTRYILDINQRWLVVEEKEIKTKLFYTIDVFNVYDGEFRIMDLMKHLSKGPDDVINLLHEIYDNFNHEVYTFNIKTGEVIEEVSVKKNASPEFKKAIEDQIKTGFKLKTKMTCQIK